MFTPAAGIFHRGCTRNLARRFSFLRKCSYSRRQSLSSLVATALCVRVSYSAPALPGLHVTVSLTLTHGEQFDAVPTIVAVLAPAAYVRAVGQLALTSVQMAEEALLPISELGMSWRLLCEQLDPAALEVPAGIAGRLHYLHSAQRASIIRLFHQE